MVAQLLQKLADAKLPLVIVDRAEIEKLRLIEAAGHIRAFIPCVHVDCDDCARQDPATVFEITPRGQRMLALRREAVPDAGLPAAEAPARRPKRRMMTFLARRISRKGPA